ncbi:MAG: cytidylate kinase-like family protein [Oscillospiraceae bacterium]|nr:cytidylate kinase-like family protein [Oscillospiraceae bacterium]
MNKIITVSREFGSGGRELGRRLADAMGMEYYDKEIITEISKHTSLSENYVRQIIEHKPHNLYPITIGRSILYVESPEFSHAQSVYSAQRDIICDLAEKSDCVIVGRCADYILKDMKPYRLFVYADMDSRVRRCMDRVNPEESFTEKELLRRIKSIDRDRAKYYEYYTGMKWGDRLNYDYCINTTNIVIKDEIPKLAALFM